MRKVTLLFVVLFVVGGCSTGTGDNPTSEPSTPTVDQAGALATPVHDDEREPDEHAFEIDHAALLAEAQRIVSWVEETRALELLEEFEFRFISQSEFQENLPGRLQPGSDAENELIRDALWALRLIPDRDLDLGATLRELHRHSTFGYFDEQTGDVVVVSLTGGVDAWARTTTANKAVQVLQAQHFGTTEAWLLDIWSDEYLASAGLIEGDAQWVERAWVRRSFSQADYMQAQELGSSEALMEAIHSTPRYIIQRLSFPFEYGYNFISQLRLSRGVGAVNDAFADPPVSSEQILHPEKYLQQPRDMPLPVNIPSVDPLLDDGWERALTGSIGEYDILLLLEMHSVSNASLAAAGWGGSDYEMYTSGDDILIVLATRWDTTDDAAQFLDALQESFGEPVANDGRWFDGERFHAIVASGDSVTLFSSTDEDALDAVVSNQ